jgi:hypothetical protein
LDSSTVIFDDTADDGATAHLPDWKIQQYLDQTAQGQRFLGAHE